MKLLRTVVIAACAIGLSLPVQGQGVPPAQPSREKLIVAARNIMLAVRYCTLITIGPDGQPQARVVDAVAPDSGFVVWIGTNHLTRKVADIKKDARVTLMYFNDAGLEYVTVVGKAVIVADSVQRRSHWKPSWSMMVKDEYRGADFVLIRVQPSRLEISSVQQGIFNDPVNWRPAIVTLP
jgi:general stress protein 26